MLTIIVGLLLSVIVNHYDEGCGKRGRGGGGGHGGRFLYKVLGKRSH